MSSDKVDLTSQWNVDNREVGEIELILRERLDSLDAEEEGITLEEVLRDMQLMLLERFK